MYKVSCWEPRPWPWGRRFSLTPTGSVMFVFIVLFDQRFGCAAHEFTGHVVLGHFGEAFDTLGGDDMHLVDVAAHHAFADRTGNIVGDDPVGALALALGLGVFDHVFRLGSEADEEMRPLAPRSHRSEDVGVFRQDERGRRAAGLGRARLHGVG